VSDDLYGPKLSPPPTSSPLVRGAGIVLAAVALVGCNLPDPPGPSLDAANPGRTAIDGGRDAASNPGIADAGVAPDMGHLNPGLPPLDAGLDADTP
jgi:hypothetical protein